MVCFLSFVCILADSLGIICRQHYHSNALWQFGLVRTHLPNLACMHSICYKHEARMQGLYLQALHCYSIFTVLEVHPITLVLANWNGHIQFLSHILKFHSYWTIVQPAEYGRSSTKSKYNKVKAVLVAGILHVVQQFLTGAHVRYIFHNRQSSSRWLCNVVCRQLWCPALVCIDFTECTDPRDCTLLLQNWVRASALLWSQPVSILSQCPFQGLIRTSPCNVVLSLAHSWHQKMHAILTCCGFQSSPMMIRIQGSLNILLHCNMTQQLKCRSICKPHLQVHDFTILSYADLPNSISLRVESKFGL